MPHGSPDYGEYAAFETIGRLVDLGELAVRLGSISHYNREGNVVFMDNFEYTPLKWLATLSDGHGSIAYSAETAWSGGQCLKMTTGEILNELAYIKRYFPIIVFSKVGVEIAWKNVDTKYEWELYFEARKDGKRHIAWLQVNLDAKTLSLFDNTDYWTVIDANFKLAEGSHLFHIFKLVVDLATDEYLTLLVDDTEYSLTDYDLYQLTTTDPDSIDIRCQIKTKEAAANICYLDNFIFTQNEV